MNSTPQAIVIDLLDYQNIEVLAYRIYLCQGSQQGRALDHWIEAEKQLRENLFCDQE